MEGAKDENAVFLDRTSRATRGKRMTKLLDEEIEDDELFWNQEALKEEEVDENYQEEGEIVDVFDSDFEDDESEPDEETVKEPDDRQRTKKKLTYPGKPSTKKKKKQKVLSELDKEPTEDITRELASIPEDHEAHDDVDAEKIVRKSTRTSVIVRQAERDAIRAALQATMKPIIRKKKEGEEKRMTQEEMLLEAAQTEIMNLRNLERVLAREEEVKKRAVVHKAVYDGPQIRSLSRDGKSYLEFSKGVSFRKQLSTSSLPYPEQEVCAITRLPAKYRDPKTGLPYATKEAFKIIRERLSEQTIIARENNKGPLTEAISGQGFSLTQKRSVREASDFRFSARFLKFPDLETQDSE